MERWWNHPPAISGATFNLRGTRHAPAVKFSGTPPATAPPPRWAETPGSPGAESECRGIIALVWRHQSAPETLTGTACAATNLSTEMACGFRGAGKPGNVLAGAAGSRRPLPDGPPRRQPDDAPARGLAEHALAP